MSKVINTIKIIWKNDRYKSIVIMSLYFIFFVVIVLIAKLSPSTKPDLSNYNTSNISIVNEYDFEVSVKDTIIKGKYDYSYIKFDYNNKTYEYSNELLYPKDFPYVDIIPFMNKNYVFELIKGKNIYSTTKFSDDSQANTYLVDNIEITTYDKQLLKIDVKINDLSYEIIYK